MQIYIAKKEHEKLLKVYILKICYQLARGVQKQVLSSLSSSCLIIRRKKIKNITQFGYKQELKTGTLKKIHFIYLQSLSQLISFLFAHSKLEKPVASAIFIDSIQQYFGERFHFNQNGKNIGICLNLLNILSTKYLGNSRKTTMKIGLSFCYNHHIFPMEDFTNVVQSFKANVWQISGAEIMKNSENYESEWSRNFFELYGESNIKQQQQ